MARSILLVFGLLASGSGCHVLNIPSYRADAPGGLCGANAADYDHAGCRVGESNSSAYMAGDDCPPGFFPPLAGWARGGLPVPAWYAEWKAKKDLPEPSPYPRFHPLPTRPMFQPAPVSQSSQWGSNAMAPSPYGQLPAAEAGNLPWGRLEGTPSVEVPQSQQDQLPTPNVAPHLPPPLAPEPLPLPAELPTRRLPR